MYIIVHTAIEDRPWREYDALILDWDRSDWVDVTTGKITAVISWQIGGLPGLKFVEVEHVSRRTSAHYWRRPDEPKPDPIEWAEILNDDQPRPASDAGGTGCRAYG